MFECLTGILAGTPIVAPLASTKAAIQNSMIIVFNVANFLPLDDYRRSIQQLKEAVKALPRRDDFDELLLPGERGDREAERRRTNGIPLPAALHAELNELRRGSAFQSLRSCDALCRYLPRPAAAPTRRHFAISLST